MLLFRDLIEGVTRYSSRILRDKFEDDISVVSSKYANQKAKAKIDFQKGNERLWNSSTKRALPGTFVQKRRRKHRGGISLLDEDTLSKIFQNLGLVNQVCLLLPAKLFWCHTREFSKINGSNAPEVPQQATIYHLPLSFVNSPVIISYELNSLCGLRIYSGHIAPNVFCLSLERCLYQMNSWSCPSKKRCRQYDGIITLENCAHISTSLFENETMCGIFSEPRLCVITCIYSMPASPWFQRNQLLRSECESVAREPIFWLYNQHWEPHGLQLALG